MRKVAGKFIFTPEDLLEFQGSEVSSWLSRRYYEDPSEDNAPLEEVEEEGSIHELLAAVVEDFENRRYQVTRVTGYEETLAAMKIGAAVILGGELRAGIFEARYDLLVRVGESYEAWDMTSAYAFDGDYEVRLFCLTDVLAQVQGVVPEEMIRVIASGVCQRFGTDDFQSDLIDVKRGFLSLQNSFDANVMPPIEKYERRGRWHGYIDALIEDQDRLQQVAGISIELLSELPLQGVDTVEKLLSYEGDMSGLDRAKIQASLQLRSKGVAAPLFEVKSPVILPEASSLDVFFDIEGFPIYEGGLEYLWGSTYKESSQLCFKAFWAHSPDEEEEAFSGFLQFVHERWQRDPSMHVYHYADYEVKAMNKVARRTGRDTELLAVLLKAGVFVDLLKVARRHVRVGSPRFSLKSLEKIYRGQRSGDVVDGAGSVVAYHRYLVAGLLGRDGADVLAAIEEYNRDDCDSTLELAAWLRSLA